MCRGVYVCVDAIASVFVYILSVCVGAGVFVRVTRRVCVGPQNEGHIIG